MDRRLTRLGEVGGRFYPMSRSMSFEPRLDTEKLVVSRDTRVRR